MNVKHQVACKEQGEVRHSRFHHDECVGYKLDDGRRRGRLVGAGR